MNMVILPWYDKQHDILTKANVQDKETTVLGLQSGTFIHPQNPIPSIDPYNQDGYNYIVNGTSYTYYMKAHSNWGDGFKFASGGYNIIYQPSDYSYRNQYGSQDYISSIADKTAVIDNIYHTATYTGVFPNVTLQYEMQSDMVKEYFIIDKLSRTPAGWLGTNVTLDFGGYIKYGTARLYVDDIDKTGTNFVTSHEIQFRDSDNNLLYYLPEPYATDAIGNSTSCYYEVKTQGQQIWFYLRTPYSFLKNATFPVKVDPTYGLIADAVTSSFEWNGQTGGNVSAIRVNNSEYYLIGAGATNGRGTLNTIRVSNNNGTLQQSNVSQWTFNASSHAVGAIFVQKVYGNVYVCAYSTTGTIMRTINVFTFRVWDTNGTIQQSRVSGEVTSEHLGQNTKSGANITSMLKMGVSTTDNIFVIAYTNYAYKLRLKSYNISNAGVITALGNVTIDPAISKKPDATLEAVDSNTFVWAYSGMGTDGWIGTRDITAAGVIAGSNTSRWEFDQYNAFTPFIKKLDNTNYYAIAYRDTDGDGRCNITMITDAGMPSRAWVSGGTMEFETGICSFPYIFRVSNNSVVNRVIYGISYIGTTSYGVTRTVAINTNVGTYSGSTYIDTLTYDGTGTNFNRPITLYCAGFFFLTAYEGTGNDGWARTYQIYANNPPTITNPSPTDGATGISTTPQLSVDVGDIGDMLNVTWSSNSSGTWQQFGTNRSNAFNQVMSYGAINTSVTNSDEWNPDNGRYPDAIKLGSDSIFSYFATVYAGPGNDGWINTTKVWNSNGTIYPGPSIDSYEYDNSDGYCPSIVHVSGDVYAIVYTDIGSSKETVVTISITSLGDIDTVTGVIDTQQLTYDGDEVNSRTANIINVVGNVFSVAYTKDSAYPVIETIWISDAGLINNSVLDTQIYRTGGTTISNPKQIMIDSDTMLIATGTFINPTGWYNLTTYNISSSGIITDTYADNWQITTGSTGINSFIVKLSNNIFLIANSYYTPKLGTVTISDTGMITKSWIDTYLPDATFLYPYILSLDNNLYAITYQGSGSDGFIKTIEITSGDISCFDYDVLEFDTADSIRYAPILPVANDYYLIVWEGNGNDGWSCTVKIGNDTTTTLKQTNANFSAAGTKYYWRVNVSDGVNTNYSIYSFTTAGAGANNPPTQNDEFPVNGSIDVSLIPTLSVICNDGDGDIMNATWLSNSSGIWVTFATNKSIASGTHIEQSNTNFSANNQIYWWSVNLSDGNGGWDNETYHFTTVAVATSWQIIDQSINGSVYNASVSSWQIISQTINGSVYNASISSWNIISQAINGSIYNRTGTWQIFSQSINGSVYNTSGIWQILSQSINGSIYNSSISSWNIISQSINGSIYNSTIPSWAIISQSINGSVYNATISSWNIISQTINGSVYNTSTSSWNIISQSINGSIYNLSGTWNIISSNINGSIYNASISSWNIISSNINGSVFNASVSSWQIISQTINGSIYNVSGAWQIISQSINGSIYNASISSWQIISQTINGSIFNVSIPEWQIISQSINGSIYNASALIEPATPYNLNLLVINPNPANGTHFTNYIKMNASGLTTSIDVFYNNFTSPPTSPPSSATIAIDGTPPANAPCLYNSSTVYNDVWANTTGTISTTDLFVGQYKAGADYVTYRGFLRFDTSIIPDDAVIDSAKVSLVILTFASLTDFNVTLQEVKSPVPHDPLIGTDYNKAAVAGDLGHENTTGYTDDDYFNITLNAGGINYINKVGNTAFGIRSDQDIAASPPPNSEIIGFYAYSFAPFYPELIISYHTPNPDWSCLVNLTWYSNSSGGWTPYYTSYANSNGTVTVPNVNFSGIDTYYWHLEWESNHTNNGSSQVFEFETVKAGAGMIMMNAKDRFLLGLEIGGLLFLIIGMVLWKKRKNNKKTK